MVLVVRLGLGSGLSLGDHQHVCLSVLSFCIQRKQSDVR